MQAQVHDFFSTSSVVTFAGATAVISVLSNTIRLLTKRNPLIVIFLISVGVAFLGAYIGHTLTNVVNVLLTVVNGCLLFCTTAGAQEAGATLKQRAQQGEIERHSQKPVKLLSSWFD
jgi:purine-cytosine permease-like protein